jgi:tetratricopeptide (TPR) repeat protein
MRHPRKLDFIRLISIGRRSASTFMVLLLAAGTVRASQSNLSGVAAELKERGDIAGAESTLQGELREARALAGPHSMKVAASLANLGVFYQDIGRFSQAETSFVSALRIAREIRGEDDPVLAPVVVHLAWLYIETGRAGDAGRLHPESWVDRVSLLEPESKYLPMLLEVVGGLQALERRFDAADDAYRKDFDLLARRGMNVSVEMASALNNFGFIQLRAGRRSEAQMDFSRALDLWMQLSDADNLQVAITRLGLAEAHVALGHYDESAELFQQVLPVFEQECGPESLRTEDVLTRYAQVLRHQKRSDEASKLEQRARLIRRAAAADLAYRQVINVLDLPKNGVAPKTPF